MNNKVVFMLFLSIWTLTFCSRPKEWQQVEYAQNLQCDSLHSGIPGHYPIKCRPYLDNDTLVIHLSDMAWQRITVKIFNGKFKAELGGVPFHLAEFSFQTKSQRLQIKKAKYEINDTLCGHFDFLFQLTDVRTDETNDWNFKGFISEIIREKDFSPFVKEKFMNFDLPTAIHEMGEPLDCSGFHSDASNMHEFRIELWNYLSPDKTDIAIKELTWDVSPTHEISDEGQERLTIWYVRRQNQAHFRSGDHYTLSDIWNNEANNISAWLPLHYMEWNAHEQY